ncbi:MAG: hypothetical protein IJJ86_05850 [Clostridia bacterium]|nr:hypothetical protein [Clostridia bacterium]
MKRILSFLLSILIVFLLVPIAGSISDGQEVVFGDADGDGVLTVQDASCITRFLSGFDGMDAASKSRADFDGDGYVTNYDVSLIMSAFVSPEEQIRTVAEFSFLVTSDLSGIAWSDSSSKGQNSPSALNAAACILDLKKHGDNSVLIDAGGSLFGSSIADEYVNSTTKEFGPITSLFRYLHYDAVLLGDEGYTYPSSIVRREINVLLDSGITVLGANLMRSETTEFDDENAPWNNLISYVIKPISLVDGSEIRVAVVGLTSPDLAPWVDEIKPADPLEIYNSLYKEITENADYVVLVYHGNVESDEARPDAFSLREFVRQTRGIDLVLSSHGKSRSSRFERNAVDRDVMIISLPGGPGTVSRVSVALRAKGNPGYTVSYLDTSAYDPNQELRNLIMPYVSSVSGVMDAIVCTNLEEIDPYQNGALSSTDCMDLIHEMQIWGAQKWIAEEGADLPPTVVSIAYPYLATEGIRDGIILYRDLCDLSCEIPRYTLMLIRGSELRSWLLSYKDRILTDDPVYSLYGLSYLLNTMNPDTPLGFLEHSSGLAVEDDELFTLIIAEEPDVESILRPYLDESWMPYEERIVPGFEMPRPVLTDTSDLYRGIDALVAFLESVGTLRLPHYYSWIVL